MNDHAPTDAPTQREILSFGDIRLDLAARELRRAGEEVAIAPKSLACLVYLLVNRDRAVGRDELVERIWGHSHITDGALSQTILQLRRLLGDAEGAKYIKSIRGFGYRWIAPTYAYVEDSISSPDGSSVAPAAVTGVEPRSIATPPGEQTFPRRRTIHRPALWLLAASLLAVVLLVRLSRVPQTAWSGHENEGALVLVLPVDVDNGEATWLRLGGMDLLATHLREAGLRVVPVETVLQLLAVQADSAPDARVRRLVEATGSQIVLQPTVRRVEHRWAVVVRDIGSGASPRVVRAEAGDALAALRNALHPLMLELGLADAPGPEGDTRLQRLRYQIRAASLDQQYDEALQLLLAAPSDLRQHHELLYIEAGLHFRRRELPLARTRFESLLQHPEVRNDPALRLRASAGLAVTLASLDELAASRALMLDLVRQPQAELDPRTAANLHLNLAVIAVGAGQRPEARASLLRARSLLTGSGDMQVLAHLDLASGILEAQGEQHADALQWLERAAAGYEAIGDRRGLARASAAVVRAQLGLLDISAAARTAERMPEFTATPAADIDNPETRLALAMLRRAQGSSAAADATLQPLLVADEKNLNWTRLHFAAQAMRAQWTLEDAGSKEQVLEAARAVLDSPVALADGQLRGIVASAWLSATRAWLLSGDTVATEQELRAFALWPGREDTALTRTCLTLALAEHAHALGRDEDAARHYRHALDIARSAGSPRLLLDVTRSNVAWLLAQSDGAAEALALVDRLGVHPDRHFEAAVLRAQVLRRVGPIESWRAAQNIADALAGERRVLPEAQAASIH